MKSKEADTYIAAAAPFARPILNRVRAAFHRTCPEATEAFKWGHLTFLYRGKILAGIAAFKSHARFHFWHAWALPDPHGLFTGKDNSKGGAMKLASLADVPSDEVLDAYIVEAMRLIEAGGAKEPREPRSPKPALTAPPDFEAALGQNHAANSAFAALSPSHRREYLEWILGAKQEQTRRKRIETTIENLAEGKSLHWKYQRAAKV